jgi:hypothetical protein
MIERDKALMHLPEPLRGELFDEFDKISRNYRERRWEASELDGGRFSEVVYSILSGYFTGTYPATAQKPNRFKDACETFSSSTYPKANFLHSARVTIPRVLVSLYEIRNNRGVGHVGGDVDSNHMDSEYVLHSAQWVMAELVRIFHGTTVAEATATVDALVERTTPDIWLVGSAKRVLDTSLSLSDKTLLLLYSTTNSVADRTLADWLEQERLGNYKRVLGTLHQKKFVEYATDNTVTISPLGIADVESRLLPNSAK